MENERRMKRLLQILPAMLLASFNGFAQQPSTPQLPTAAYTLHPILTPETVVAGHVMGPETKIGTAVVNDNGLPAFVANWPDHDKVASAVYTLQRRVVGSGDVIDGHVIELISPTAQLAINATGIIAYSASYAGSDTEGIFVEKHTAFDLKSNSVPTGTPFAFNDKGAVVIAPAPSHVVCSATPAQPTQEKKPSFWGTLGGSKIFRLPGGGTIGGSGGAGTPPPGPPAPKPQSAQVCAESALTMLSSNSKGQILIPINSATGPYLLVGTPVSH